MMLVPALVSLLLLWPARRAGAAEYTVGDGPNGWDTGTNYATWAQNRAFTVGDVLVFEYLKGQHNVYEVTEAAYRSCDASSVLARYATGYDRVQLTEPKSYWFICEIPGHCMGGMKVAVNVSAAGPAGGGLPAPNVQSPPPSASPAGGRRSWMAWAPLALGVHVLVNWAS